MLPCLNYFAAASPFGLKFFIWSVWCLGDSILMLLLEEGAGKEPRNSRIRFVAGLEVSEGRACLCARPSSPCDRWMPRRCYEWSTDPVNSPCSTGTGESSALLYWTSRSLIHMFPRSSVVTASAAGCTSSASSLRVMPDAYLSSSVSMFYCT